ncbi:MAG: toxin-antitoxin system YwqK family antitoxin [Brumimicrobium sp.]
MLKHIVTIIILIFSLNGLSQVSDNINIRRGPCFQKALDRIDQRYPDWECDLYGNKIIDCNQALESDPESSVVFLKSNGKPFTGDCETCHMNGIKQHSVSFENGLINGTDTSYYASGCPQVVKTYIHGVENGRWTYYNDSSGLVAWEMNFFNGEKHGKAIYFRQTPVGTATTKYVVNGAEENWNYTVYENDTIKIENYVEGILHGEKREYFWPDSKVKKIVHYNMGIMDGAFLQYNKDGEVLQELFYDKGKKEGEWKYYYDDGSLLRTESWKKDVKDGEFKVFFIDGNLQSLETYRKGVKEGKFLEYFSNNALKREAIYRKGELVEEHVYDVYGNEITTKGEANANDEDDALPDSNKKNRKRK